MERERRHHFSIIDGLQLEKRQLVLVEGVLCDPYQKIVVKKVLTMKSR